MKNADELDDLFRNAFDDAELSPDIQLWKGIQNHLEFESTLAAAFESAELTPSEAVWAGIGESLGVQQVSTWQKLFASAALPVSGQVWKNIEAVLDNKKPVAVPIWTWLTAAACLLFVFFVWVMPNITAPSQELAGPHEHLKSQPDKNIKIKGSESQVAESGVVVHSNSPASPIAQAGRPTGNTDKQEANKNDLDAVQNTAQSEHKNRTITRRFSPQNPKHNSVNQNLAQEQGPLEKVNALLNNQEENPEEVLLTSANPNSVRLEFVWLSRPAAIGRLNQLNPDFTLVLQKINEDLLAQSAQSQNTETKPERPFNLNFMTGLGAQVGTFRPNLQKTTAQGVIKGANVVADNLSKINSFSTAQAFSYGYGLDFGLLLNNKWSLMSGLYLNHASVIYKDVLVAVESPILGTEPIQVPITLTGEFRMLQVPILVGLNLGKKKLQANLHSGLSNDLLLQADMQSSQPADFTFVPLQRKSMSQNMVLGAGLAYNLSPTLSLGVQGQYRSALGSWLKNQDLGMKPEQAFVQGHLYIKL